MNRVAAPIDKLERLLTELRKVDPELPAHHALSLVLVAQAGDDGLTQADLARKLNVGKSTAQRIFDKLGNEMVGDRPGLGLLRRRPNPENALSALLFLTPAGRGVLHSLETKVEA